MDHLSVDIAKMEYNRLASEISSIQKENNEIARYAVIADTSVCAVIVTHQHDIQHYYYLLKLLPFIITALFSFRIIALYKRVELISKYIEFHFENDILKRDFEQLGWETFLNNNIRNTKVKRSWAQVSAVLFWLVLNALCFVFIFF